jgi:CubicO group peptidase (beta-lactamase class C family)
VNTQLLALILEKATGQKVSSYLQEKIWQPLGMAHEATWNIDSKKGDTEKAFCCINGRAKDFAKLGRLYLNKGNWNGKEIVTREWVEEAVNFKTRRNNFVYSNQFWHTRRISKVQDTSLIKEPFVVYYPKKANQEPIMYRASGDYFAQGFLGQYVYVSPKQNIIIVRLAKKEGGVIWPPLMRDIAEKN